MNAPIPEISTATGAASQNSASPKEATIVPTPVPIPVPTTLQINWNVILLAIIAAVPPTIVAVASYMQSIKTHDIVNSRMDEFKTLVIKSSGDAAVLKEKAAVAEKEAERKSAISDFVLPPKIEKGK